MSPDTQMHFFGVVEEKPTYDELLAALRALRNGPVFHCVPEDHEKHWPQIAAADILIARISS